ncbi:MAG: sulfotransferase family protein [Aeromicrobium sp.]
MTTGEQRGPDLLLAGASRSGTTTLAASIGRHPDVVSPSIKEPNFFSTRRDRGQAWYESLFGRPDGIWIDASAQYSYPSHLAASARAAELNPDLRIVYLVRDPLPRAYSHYCHEVLYMGHYGGVDFGSALRACDDILGASDYGRVIASLTATVSEDRLLILPFEYVVSNPERAAETVWSFVGLPSVGPEDLVAVDTQLFTNERAVFASPLVRRAFKALRTTRIYPHVRAVLGAERIRRARARLTNNAIPSLDAALSTCSSAQRALIAQVATRSAEDVRKCLQGQDARNGTGFVSECTWLDGPTLQ